MILDRDDAFGFSYHDVLWWSSGSQPKFQLGASAASKGPTAGRDGVDESPSFRVLGRRETSRAKSMLRGGTLNSLVFEVTATNHASIAARPSLSAKRQGFSFALFL